jgi:ferredoxin-type protein NapH
MRTAAVQKLRTVSQTIFLALFLFFVLQGKSQLWLLVFAVSGLGLSLFFGRFYCGWICPMGTVLRGQSRLMKKLNIKRREPSQRTLNRVWPRLVFLVLLAATMVVMQRSGRKLPVLLYLTLAAPVVSLFFHESLWHRQICPLGAMLAVTGRFSRRRMRIETEPCIGCGACERVCPSRAITREEDGKKRTILARECLECGLCQKACPVSVIYWDRGVTRLNEGKAEHETDGTSLPAHRTGDAAR